MKQKLKILHVLYSGLGGHGNVFFSLVAADSQKEFVHEALFNGVEDIREEYAERCNKNDIRFSFVKKKAGLDLGFYIQLIKAIKSADPHIIFLHGSTQVFWAKIALLLKKQKGTILVRETQANHLKTKQDWFWLSMALVLANKIVFLTNAYQLEIKKKLALLYNRKKVAVIANGIDLNKYQPHSFTNTGSLVFGMQSRIVKIKDHITLLHAFANLLNENSSSGKKYCLKIAGDGECRPGLEQLAKQLHIEQHVEFTGMLNEQQLPAFLSELDIYIHASFGETMSTAIIQAMACGLPVIASDVPGINNMLQDGITGLLVPVQNIAALTAAMQHCVNDFEYRKQLAANACTFAQTTYSNQTMFAAYKKLF